MNFLGIDPGQTGGLVLLNSKLQIVDKSIMPIDGSGDIVKQELADILCDWNQLDSFHIYLERIIPFAMTAKSAMTFGRQIGMIELLIWSKSYPVTFVEASKWTKEIHQGIDSNLKAKVKSSVAVERLFPGVNLRATEKSKKNHDGLIDALLIAEYGRRKYVTTRTAGE